MIAVKAMRYGGKSLLPGDEFEPRTPRDARILRAIGKAKDAEPEVAKPESEAPDERSHKKRAYRRKDMNAEG